MSRQKSMTYLEALSIIEDEGRRLGNLAHNIPSSPEPTVEKAISFYSTVKTLSGSLLGTLSLIPAAIFLPAVMPVALAVQISFVFLMTGFAAPFLLLSPSAARRISPLKYRKIRDEAMVNARFEEMKRAEFERVEEESLRVSKKALKVINESMKSSGLEMKYLGASGSYTFTVDKARTHA